MGSGGGGEGGGVPGRQQPVQLQPVSRMASHVSRLRSWPHVMECTSQTLPHSPGGDEGSGGDGGGGEGGGEGGGGEGGGGDGGGTATVCWHAHCRREVQGPF